MGTYYLMVYIYMLVFCFLFRLLLRNIIRNSGSFYKEKLLQLLKKVMCLETGYFISTYCEIFKCIVTNFPGTREVNGFLKLRCEGISKVLSALSSSLFMLLSIDFCISILISETTVWIRTKFGRNVHWMVINKVFIFHQKSTTE